MAGQQTFWLIVTRLSSAPVLMTVHTKVPTELVPQLSLMNSSPADVE